MSDDDAMADVRAWNDLTARAERAEAAIQRVRALATHWAADFYLKDEGQAILAALDSTDPPPDESGLRMVTCTCEVITGGARVRRHRCPMHPDNWADDMRDQLRDAPERSDEGPKGCLETRRCPIPDDPCEPGRRCWEGSAEGSRSE